MGEACGTHEEEVKCLRRKTWNGSDHSEDLRVDGREIIKLILKKQDV